MTMINKNFFKRNGEENDFSSVFSYIVQTLRAHERTKTEALQKAATTNSLTRGLLISVGLGIGSLFFRMPIIVGLFIILIGTVTTFVQYMLKNKQSIENIHNTDQNLKDTIRQNIDDNLHAFLEELERATELLGNEQPHLKNNLEQIKIIAKEQLMDEHLSMEQLGFIYKNLNAYQKYEKFSKLQFKNPEQKKQIDQEVEQEIGADPATEIFKKML